MSQTPSSLQLAQDRLQAAGVKDVKFFFDPASMASMPLSELSDGLAKFINSYLDGNYTELEYIGDSPVAA